MTTHRKEFGKRGSVQPASQHAGPRRTHVSATAAGPAFAPAGSAYTAASASTDAFAHEGAFSVWTMITSVFSLLFSFHGRIGRKTYWGIGVPRFILFIALIVSFAGTFNLEPGENFERTLAGSLVTTGVGLTYLAIFAALLACYWSIEVRRSHDRDASGMLLLIMFIPIAGTFYALYVFVANGFFPGTRGPNRFDTTASQASVFD